MNEKNIKNVLHTLGAQAFPNVIDPWKHIQAQIDRGTIPSSGKKIRERKTSIRWLVAAATIIMVILAVWVISEPENNVLAQAWRNLFNTIEEEELPLPSSEQLATPTFAPAFAVTFTSSAATPVPILTDPKPSNNKACDQDPYGYSCKVAQAEKRAGFDAREFPQDPDAFVFRNVVRAEPGIIMMEYDLIGGGGYLYFSQGTGNEFPSYSFGVPENAIEPVLVGMYPGEYVVGEYVVGGIYDTYTWLPAVRQRLRWLEDGKWYEIDDQSATPATEYITKEYMIQMALNLVYEPNADRTIREDYLTSLEQTAQLTEFNFLAPTILPRDFKFSYADYSTDESRLVLHYYPSGAEDKGIAEIKVVETLLDKVHLSPIWNGEDIIGETVDIQGITGIYFSDSPYNHIVTWATDTLKITLWVYSSDIWYGAAYTKEQVLEIAGSFK